MTNVTGQDESLGTIVALGGEPTVDSVERLASWKRLSQHSLVKDVAMLGLANLRRFTTVDSDAGDAKLTTDLIRNFGAEFSDGAISPRHLLYMLKRWASLPPRDLAQPLEPRTLWRTVKRVDSALLRWKPLRAWCGEAIIVYQK